MVSFANIRRSPERIYGHHVLQSVNYFRFVKKYLLNYIGETKIILFLCAI
jgi:hypothetical protein